MRTLPPHGFIIFSPLQRSLSKNHVIVRMKCTTLSTHLIQFYFTQCENVIQNFRLNVTPKIAEIPQKLNFVSYDDQQQRSSRRSHRVSDNLSFMGTREYRTCILQADLYMCRVCYLQFIGPNITIVNLYLQYISHCVSPHTHRAMNAYFG